MTTLSDWQRFACFSPRSQSVLLCSGNPSCASGAHSGASSVGFRDLNLVRASCRKCSESAIRTAATSSTVALSSGDFFVISIAFAHSVRVRSCRSLVQMWYVPSEEEVNGLMARFGDAAAVNTDQYIG